MSIKAFSHDIGIGAPQPESSQEIAV
jgi:hypothetical protein